MSIILKPTKMKFKDPVSGNYVGINAISDEKAQDVINAWLRSNPGELVVTPLRAATAAAMTNTAAIYIYTGSQTGYTYGNWYYYDGTTWLSGGVYSPVAIDDTLTQQGIPADAKATGDELTDLKSVLNPLYSNYDINIELYSNSVNNNTILNGSGGTTGGTGYKTSSFPVCEGARLYLKLASTGRGVYQFSTSASAGTSYLIGTPVSRAVNAIVTVPTGAKYILISEPMESSTSVYGYVTADSNEKTKWLSIYGGTLVTGNWISFGITPSGNFSLDYKYRSLDWYVQCTNDIEITLNGMSVLVSKYTYDGTSYTQTSQTTYTADTTLYKDVNAYYRFTLSKSGVSSLTPNDITATIVIKSDVVSDIYTRFSPDISTNDNIDFGWEMGTLNNGYPTASTYRIRSAFIVVGQGSVIKCDASLYQHSIYLYDFSERVITSIAWTRDDITIDRDCLIRILIAKRSSAEFTTNEVETIGSTEIIYRILPESYYGYTNKIQNEIEPKLPSYYDDEIGTAITNTRQHIFDAGINGDSFLFLSDVHWGGNRKKSPLICRDVIRATSVGKIICGGDMQEGDGTTANVISEANDFIDAFKKYAPFYTALGNHDTNDSQDTGRSDRFTKSQAYALYQKCADQYMTYGIPCYYYFDNPTAKTRYIVLDSGLETLVSDDTQITWLNQVLSNTDSEWHVIVVIHIVYLSYTATNFAPFFSDVANVLDSHNAQSDVCKIEAIFGGHVHYDRNTTTIGGIPIVLIDCDGSPTESEAGSTVGTINENCLDVVTINYDTSTIYCERIGRGNSRTITY